MPVVFFITRPDVATDPSVPVPDWRSILNVMKADPVRALPVTVPQRAGDRNKDPLDNPRA